MEAGAKALFLSSCRTGSGEALASLLQQQSVAVDLETRDERGGMSGLMWSSMMGHTEIVHMLLTAGAAVDATDAAGWTSLHLACRWGQIDCVRILVGARWGCNIHRTNLNGGRNALMRAALRDHVDICILLIGMGQDLYARDVRGETALDMYGRELEEDIVRADVDSDGETSSQSHTPTPLAPQVREARRAQLVQVHMQVQQRQHSAMEALLQLGSVVNGHSINGNGNGNDSSDATSHSNGNGGSDPCTDNGSS